MTIGVYPGSFDPVTNGHLDIIKRSASIFDRVIVAVTEDNNKVNLFSLQERYHLLREVTGNSHFENVSVEMFSGLLINYVREKEASAIIRGLRAVSDFEYEMQFALMNKKMAPDVETLFLTTSTEYSFLSSSIVKQVASLGGCVRGLVPPTVEDELILKYKNKKGGR
ncbi:MAG: pantetheine-phosphate adenylyltransferase [Clostridia bacterium]|nr:pantetheine-phosphate adenylyltransferase [Clostridia bacterium]